MRSANSLNTVVKTWIILGASSSIGRAFARRATEQGADVVLAGRDIDDLERTAKDLRVRSNVLVTVNLFNAMDFGSHKSFAEIFRNKTGPLGIFLLFGTMPDQSIIDNDATLALETVNTNYLGAISILSQFARRLELDGKGCIVVMSSVAGDRGRLKNYVYGSSKAGLNTYLQGLRARLHRSGISVTTIKAGFIDTDMSFGKSGMFLVATPDKCAKICLNLAQRGREIVYFPWFWRYIMLVIRFIPEKLFKQLNI